MQTLYIDSLVLLNFSINFLILLATAKLTGAPYSWRRLAAAALAGAGYAVSALFWPLLETWPLKLVVALLLTFIGLGRRQLLRRGILFFGTSFAFGGGVYALWIMAGGRGSFSLYATPAMRTVLLCASICYCVLSLGFRMAARHGGDRIIKVTVKRGKKQVDLKTLVDSGDTLSDPVTNKPVLLAEKKYLESLLDDKEKEKIDPRAPVSSLERLASSGGGTKMRLTGRSASRRGFSSRCGPTPWQPEGRSEKVCLSHFPRQSSRTGARIARS